MNVTAWLCSHLVAAGVGLDPTPGDTGFDYDKIKPDPAAVPRSDLFYQILNGVMFLGIAAAVGGLMAGAAAFAAGPILGSHHVTDRAKTTMLRAGVSALVLGSTTAIIAFLFKA